MLKRLVCSIALLAPAAAHASQALDLSCDGTVRSFFEPLVQARLINTTPFNVEKNSINHFEPKPTKELTAYGMPVVSIFGYTDDRLLFIKKSERQQDVYGAIVREGIANVQAQLSSVGAKRAVTYRLDATTTMIACKL